MLKVKKLGSIKKAKAAVTKKEVGNYPMSVPAEGITVRFLEEPDEWYEIRQYWDKGDKSSYIVTEETPQHFVKESYTRFVMQVVDVDENRVIALSIPKTVAQMMMKRHDKHHTVMDRNYEITKDGEGMQTRYQVTPDAPSKMNLDRFELIDIMEMLEGMVPGDEGDDFDDDDDYERPSRKKSRPSSKKRNDDYDDDDEDDDDEEDEEPVRKSRPKRRPTKEEDDDVDDDDDDDDEPVTRRRPRRRK